LVLDVSQRRHVQAPIDQLISNVVDILWQVLYPQGALTGQVDEVHRRHCHAAIIRPPPRFSGPERLTPGLLGMVAALAWSHEENGGAESGPATERPPDCG
jgi:hypothetical protein